MKFILLILFAVTSFGQISNTVNICQEWKNGNSVNDNTVFDNGNIVWYCITDKGDDLPPIITRVLVTESHRESKDIKTFKNSPGIFYHEHLVKGKYIIILFVNNVEIGKSKEFEIK